MRRNEIIQGDALNVLRTLPDDYVQMTCCSPPYWGLRDYGVPGQLGLEKLHDCQGWATGERCGECHVCRMTEIFREVRRVTRPDGTLWVNYGDSYAGSWGNYHPNSPPGKHGQRLKETQRWNRPAYDDQKRLPPTANLEALKPKDLCGIPWRIAFSLQADGWYLRSDIIWHKPNPMPESVTDRPTKSHEYLFLFSKSARYYYDQEAVRERTGNESSWEDYAAADGHRMPSGNLVGGVGAGFGSKATCLTHPSGRNIRSVWTIPTQAYPEAHFATFPEKLIVRPILAGSPPKCCGVCGTPWVRIVEKNEALAESRRGTVGYESRGLEAGRRFGSETPGYVSETTTLGWRSGCEHSDDTGRSIVLDPFMGSGTTAKVARDHGRDYLGIELSAQYCELATRRLAQEVMGL